MPFLPLFTSVRIPRVVVDLPEAARPSPYQADATRSQHQPPQRACEQHLDDEYASLCRTLVVRLARKRPSPLDRGDARIWAACVVYTVGSINFRSDKSQTPHLRADKLAEHVGVVQSTMANKSARIRTLLGLSWYEPELTRCSILEQNPFAWFVTVNGIPVDARTLPGEIQDEARRLGLIPDLDRRRAA